MKHVVLILTALVLTKPAHAIEPISIIATLAGAVISPIICKEIECTKDVHVHIEKGNGNQRLREMRDSFKWDESLDAQEETIERTSSEKWKKLLTN